MFNPYHSEPARITKITPQTDTVSLFRFEFAQKIWGHKFSFKPGQFIELSIPGFGEAPFAPCAAPEAGYLELCIRRVGALSEKLHSMKTGDKVGIRGPYGHGWPIQIGHSDPANAGEESPTNVGNEVSHTRGIASPRSSGARNDNPKNLLIVVGGLGLIPLRTLILGKEKFLGKDAKVQIFYGAKTPKEFLFRDEFNAWRKNGIESCLTIDKECPGWDQCVGVVTSLFDKHEIASDSSAFVCGPPIMYRFVLEKLKEKAINENNIFLSLERRMHCGLGVCQHCAVGHYYTCKDGPVFPYNRIKDIPGAI